MDHPAYRKQIAINPRRSNFSSTLLPQKRLRNKQLHKLACYLYALTFIFPLKVMRYNLTSFCKNSHFFLSTWFIENSFSFPSRPINKFKKKKKKATSSEFLPKNYECSKWKHTNPPTQKLTVQI